MPEAREIMETHVVTISPQEPLSAVHRLFVEEGITGAPVVDEQDRVLGVISSSDLLRAAADEHDTVRADVSYFRDQLEFSGSALASTPEDYLDRVGERTAEEIMSPEVVIVPPDTPISVVARTLRSQQIHRLLVVDEKDGRLVGIITTFDLVGLLEKD